MLTGFRVALAAAFVAAAVSGAVAQTPEERAAARGLITKHGDAVITVTGTTVPSSA